MSIMEEFEKAKGSSNHESLICMVKSIFSSLDSLSISFLSSITARNAREDDSEKSLDLAMVERFYDAASKLKSAEIRGAIMESTDVLLSFLLFSLAQGSMSSDNSRIVQCVIIMLENCFFLEPEYYGILEKLWKLMLGLPINVKASVLETFERYTDEQLERLVTVVQQYITIRFYAARYNDETVESAVKVLKLLYTVNEKTRLVSHMIFYNDAVNHEDFDILEDFGRWRESDRYAFSFCKYPFVYDPSSKSKILQLDSGFQMRDQVEDAILRSIFLGGTCPFLVLRVRRDNLIQETISQIQVHADDLKKPLKVQFVGEEGVDEGGLQKEFFQLVVRDIFDPKYGMFSYNEETHLCWFNSSPLDMKMEFDLVGILLGLAIYNGHILELHFPRVVYKKLLGKVPTLEDLAEVNPTLAKGLNQLLNFDGDVEGVFLRNFQVSVQDMFGEIITIDLKENGCNIPVTRKNRQEYVDLCVKYYLETSIAQSFEAFKQGFQKLCEGHVLKLFHPVELEQLVCGSPVLDFEALEKGTEYENGYRRDSRTIREFWEIVHSLEEENKKKLLFFATGSDRAPIKGLANLQFVISRNGSDSNRLPTAHTCFNHLLLPEYRSKEKMRDRLLTAISNSQGFGLM